MTLAKVCFASLCLGAAVYAGTANANCTAVVQQDGTLGDFYVDRGQSLIVDPDLPSGTVIRDTGASNATTVVRCTAPTQATLSAELQPTGSTNDIREILVVENGVAVPSGIGIRFYLQGQNESGYNKLPYDRNVTFPQGDTTWQSSLRAEYVRLGGQPKYGFAVSNNDRLGRVWVPGGVWGTNRVIHRIFMRNLHLIRPTCSMDVASLNQEVDLGNYKLADLQNGTVTPDWKRFDLTMASCPNPQEVLADITFGTTGDMDGSNPNLFSMNANGPSGLGIAIQTDTGNLPMLPGQSREFAAVATGQAFPFRARLERNGDNLTVGNVDRPVTVRVTFR